MKIRARDMGQINVSIETTIDVQVGCTQGDIDSPVIFNLVVDAVIRGREKLWRNLPLLLRRRQSVGE